MKKILLIADSNMSLSGVPVVFMSIVRQLQNNYTFDIIVLNNNDMYFEQEFLSYGGKIYLFPFEKPDGFFKKLKWLNSYYKRVSLFLKKNINLSQYTAIHSFNEGFSYPFLNEAKKHGIKCRILHINSAASAYPKKVTLSQIVFDWYQKLAIKRSTNLIFVSKKALQLNNYKNKGIVLYNTYDDKVFNKIVNCNHNNLVLTQIGTFSERKNQLFSLKVLKRIKCTFPNMKLLFIGNEIEKGYLGKIIDYIKENHLEKNVIFCEKDTNKLNMYKKTSFVIYPSKMESFGLVLIESQLCGIHCFANKNLPNDANIGNVDFLELNEDVWSNKIIEYFKKDGNKRREPNGIDIFSPARFKKSLLELYSH